MIYSAEKYKFAKIVSKDLNKALAIIDRSLKDLSPYIRYTRVAKAVSSLKENRTIIKTQIDFHDKIVKNKGSVNET